MFRSQVADELVSELVLPLTTAVLPTNCSAWVDCAVCCNDTNVCSEELALSCCSTPANSTSCWVNWLVSSGSSGFWFCSCVVKSCRKVWKLPAICCEASALVPFELEPAGSGVLPDTTEGAVVAEGAVIFVSLHPDVDAAARTQRAAVGLSRKRGRHAAVLTHQQPLRVAVRLVVALPVLLTRRRLITQRELQAV